MNSNLKITLPLNNFGRNDYFLKRQKLSNDSQYQSININKQYENNRQDFFIPLMNIARPYHVEPIIYNYIYNRKYRDYSNIHGHINPGYGMVENYNYYNTLNNPQRNITSYDKYI
jgi:hypothetical protein